MRDSVSVHLIRAVKAALARRGWEIQTSPGEPVILVSSKGRLDPSQLVTDVLYHKVDAGEWDRLCTELDIGGVELGGCCGNPVQGEDLSMMLVDENLRVQECPPNLRQNAERRVLKAFGKGGSGFSDRGLYAKELVVGPFLWDAMRVQPLYGAAPIATAKKCERRLLPLRLKRIDQARRPDVSPDEVVAVVTYATFHEGHVMGAASALSDLYPGQGEIERVWMRDLHLRSIPHWEVLWEPMLVLRIGDRRLFLQFDRNAKLIYVDDYSLAPWGGARAPGGPGGPPPELPANPG